MDESHAALPDALELPMGACIVIPHFRGSFTDCE